ncbi:hypothetical protein DRN97_05525 [Methanosarcinales archaeon]|nr:MAG: hypothetical protein DRN97_05525 [Methanosarcinales archaeon]
MEKRVLGTGILRDDFSIINHIYKITVPKGTAVVFRWNNLRKRQEIKFIGVPVIMFRSGSLARESQPVWLVKAWNRLLRIRFDNKIPYPVSFFNN